MAKKKYKNIKVEQEELKPIAIGAFESRKKTSIGTFIILTIFVLVVIFLPQISDAVNEYLNPTVNTPTTPNTPADPDEPDNPDDGDNEDETFYEYVANLQIEREDITVSEINIDAVNYTLTYNVTNNANTYQDIEDLNYYIEIYNSERTLIERVKLSNSTFLAGGAFQTFTKNISEEAATTVGYLVLVSKTIDDYPEIELSTDAGGNSTLVCTNTHETVTYEFTDNALKEVTSIVEYLTTDPEYTEIYSTYQTLANTYNSTTGITSNFFISTGGFNITTIVNLEEANRSYVFNADTFELDTEPKVVNFEMETQGFDCN